ncbi:type IV pilus assembly protein PilB [Oikeobacillus pervagus]|uniref:Type IV pilus assembly protein PilB n=1 Tax=Oikeobacillus pervagus TaxID=1325931 RepID=A0AAJ1SXF6_9BACI|nr:ATPase, T2SS/T4P/T4SS family [Oikeobacillus pervagus]MDQ0214540.1 type IV pilus assembly protein PilB [Oikeobacillus pervagus]
MRKPRKRLGDLLIESGLISDDQLQKALAEKGEDQKLGDALLQRGYITEQQLIEVLEFQLGIPHISLYRYPFDPTLFHLIPKEVAKRHLIIPLKKEENRLFVAMSDPMDYFAIEDLRLSTGFQIETAIATKDDIVRSINKYYEIDAGLEEFFVEAKSDQPKNEAVVDDDSPIVKLVNQILANAVAQKASDIHIDPHETKVLIRIRVDGLLQTERQLPKYMQNMLIARVKILANLDITEHRVPQDGRFKATVDLRPIDLRVSSLPTVYGEKIVMRLLDMSSSLNDLQQLGFNQVNLKRFESMIKRPNGIVLITGPTGSGKSSTLYATLNRLNQEEVNIITVEDPVEYQVEGVNQIQVYPNVGLTFAAGLRSILRQDPNIIMVGEIRDKETVEIAVRASLTGHLVLSTIHTNDSLSTITRLMDMGVEPFLIASSINGIVAQRLVRKVCRDCAHRESASKREIEIFARRGIKIDHVVRGKGCSSCNMTGYKGRLAIHEVLDLSDEIKNLILNDEPFSRLREEARRQKTIFLLDDGLLKVKQGLTTTEEVLRVALME